MQLCLSCKQDYSHCLFCRSPAANLGKQPSLKKAGLQRGKCVICIDSHVMVTPCTACNGMVCTLCSYRAPIDTGPFVCFSCKGKDKFFGDLSDQALKIQEQTRRALSSPFPTAQDQVRAKTRLEFQLYHFCTMVDLLNSLLQYSLLSRLWPLLIKVVEFQQRHQLRCDLMTLQTVRLHMEGTPEHNQLVRHVALQVAQETRLLGSADGPAYEPRLEWSKSPTIAFAVRDVHGEHPLMHLMYSLLKLLMSIKEIKVYIIAIQEPNLECRIVKELHTLAGKSWIQVELPQADDAKNKQTIRTKIKSFRITVLFDLIGPSAAGSELWRGVCRPGREAGFILLWLNEAALSWDRISFSGVILDPWMSRAVPDNDPQADTVYYISSWQPGMQVTRELPRSTRTPWVKHPGRQFGIHTPVDLTRIAWSCLKVLLSIMMKLDDAVLYFEGFPLVPLCATMRNMEAFAEKNGLPKDHFVKRVQWWGFIPMDSHAKRLRDNVHLCVSFGSAEGHTGVHLALGAGVPVLTTEGSSGGGDVAAWVAASMLCQVGLGALVLPHGEERKIVDLVRQLYEDGRLLTALQHVLDTHASQGTSLFSYETAARDVTDLAIKLHSDQKTPEKDARNFISCRPEGPFLIRDGCRLEPTARLMLVYANLDIDIGPEPLETDLDAVHGFELLEEGYKSLGSVLVTAAVVGEAEGAASYPPVCGLPHCVVIFQC